VDDQLPTEGGQSHQGGPFDLRREQQLVSERFQSFRIARRQKTITAYPVKAFGQHKLKVTAQKFIRG
jgi:hypothetical protein